MNEATLQQTKDAITAKYPRIQLFAHPGNIADAQFADFWIQHTVRKFGRVDYAVNCAGVLGQPARSAEMSLDEFDRVNNINYRGCWLASRAQLRQMIKQDALPSHDPERPAQRGAIVNIASQLGIVGRPGAREYIICCSTRCFSLSHGNADLGSHSAAYCASKSAIIGMTRADAIDYSQDGIRVNCVCPGVIETPLIMAKAEIREAVTPAAQIAPMQRMGKPAEVADAALFLCSSQASFVQGHALVVDGGYITV